MQTVRKVPVPRASHIFGVYPATHLADAFEVALPDDASADPEILARHLFANPAPWSVALMRARDAIVAPFGVKTSNQFRREGRAAAQEQISIFKVMSRYGNEIVFGQDDTHLNFRASVFIVPKDFAHPHRRLLAVTVVHCHNVLGRTYIALIAPFHRLIVASSLRRAGKFGWPVFSQTKVAL